MNLLHWNCKNILAISNYTPITKEQLLTEYKPVFVDMRHLKGDYHFVDDKCIPPVVHPLRKVSIALKVQLKSELDRQEPTNWVASCLMVVKPNTLRICFDPKYLNKALKRRHYPLPTIEEVLPQLTLARFSAYWMPKMDSVTSNLITIARC